MFCQLRSTYGWLSEPHFWGVGSAKKTESMVHLFRDCLFMLAMAFGN